jgi:hypothetical protein
MSRTPRLVIANDNPRNRVMTTLSVTEAVQIVRENPSTPFARDLVAAFDRYGDRINGSKRAWLIVIAQQIVDRRQRAAEPRPVERITEDFAGLTVILTKARESGKKFPKIALRTAAGTPVVLSLAGERSKSPGSVQVTDGGKFGDNVWYGRVEPSGAWIGGRDASPDVLELLRAFAADPQGVATAYGRETGECCFCQAELTDERSVLQGYGPICAQRYSLPWGDRPAGDVGTATDDAVPSGGHHGLSTDRPDGSTVRTTDGGSERGRPGDAQRLQQDALAVPLSMWGVGGGDVARSAEEGWQGDSSVSGLRQYQTRTRGPQAEPDLRDLAHDAAPMQPMSGLHRGEYNGLRPVEDVHQLPGGHGGASEPSAHDRSHRRREGLRAGQLSVGDQARTGSQSAEQRLAGDRRGANDTGGLASTNQHESRDLFLSSPQGNDTSRGNHYTNRTERREAVNNPPTPAQIAARDQREADLRYKAQFAALERKRELEGFESDPDYSGFRASGSPGTALSLEGLLEGATAVAARDGYLAPRDERAPVGAGPAPWRDDD